MKIHTYASPSTHPSAAERFLGHDDHRIASLARELHETLTSAYESLGTIDDGLVQIRANRELTPSAKQKKIAEMKDCLQENARDAIRKVGERVQTVLDRQLVGVEEALARCESPANASEIRSHVAGLPNLEKRIEFIREQARSGNKEAIGAVLRNGQHRYLAGFGDMTDADFTALRTDTMALLDPERAQTIATLRDLAKVTRDAVAGVGFLDEQSAA